MNSSREIEKIEGQVEMEVVAQGTASEHKGIVLTTDDGVKHTLQRIGGNPFRDSVTENLAGRRACVEGFPLGNVFRFTTIHEVKTKGKRKS